MKQRDPDFDFGFYANIPRKVRTEYKDLTPVQKWLYVCLKDLCGESGTCFRTVKVLSQETDISTGMISESIPLLQDAQLIHAEKKSRSTGGKAVWHITITDIWASNGKLHPTKRSHSEQTLENVHTVNNNIHTVNDNTDKRSQDELERSHSETEERSLSNITSEERSITGEGVGSGEPTAPDNITHLEEKRQKRGDTNPRMKAVAKGKTDDTPTLPTDIPDSPGSSTGNDTVSQEQEGSQSPPGASSQRAATEKAAGQSELEPPKMAMTARQIKAQNEKREKELWAIIEAERNTKYTATQRKLYENSEGMKCLIADDISDETIRDGLQALDAFQRKSFTILKFYGWLPNLNAKTPTPITSKAPSQNGYDKHELNMRKLEERKARLAAHG